MGWALQGFFQKRTESDCCSTWGAKTKEPSLPVGLWESRLWSGPERESSLMKYWCFLFFLTESCGSSVCSQDVCADPQYCSAPSLDENGLDSSAQGVLSVLMGLMMTPHSGPELVRDLFSCWSKGEVFLISPDLFRKTRTSDVCLTTSLQILDSKACTWLKSLFCVGRLFLFWRGSLPLKQRCNSFR